MNTNGSRIAALRWELGLTQAQLAERTDINVTHLSRIENGKRIGTPSQIKALADVFGVPVSHLLETGDAA